MYKVLCDDQLIYTPQLQALALVNPVLKMELNTAGSFTFTMYKNHPFYNLPKKLKSIIKVLKNNQVIFIGRVLNEELGWYEEKALECEGCIAFLNDSIVRPYDFSTGTAHTSTTELFSYYITQHNSQVDNSKKFIAGNVTVVDDYIKRANSQYSTAYESIKGKLLDLNGGYLVPRYEANGVYLDYLKDFATTAAQKITFGVNLLELNQKLDGGEIITRVLPLGAADEESGKRLTIESVNGGVDYVEDAEAVAQYGAITKVVEWDNVTVATNLKNKALAYLATAKLQNLTVDIKAIDLSNVDSSEYPFRLGQYVIISDKAHDLSATMLLNKITYNLSSPDKDTLELTKIASGDERQIERKDATVKVIETATGQSEIRTQTENNYTMILQNEREIALKASREIVDDLTGDVMTLSTHFEVTSDGVFISKSGDRSNATKITNDGLSVLVNGVEVAKATSAIFNCDKGLGVNGWVIVEGSRPGILNFIRRG